MNRGKQSLCDSNKRNTKPLTNFAIVAPLVLSQCLWAQLKPVEYDLAPGVLDLVKPAYSIDAPPEPGERLPSNSIIDIVPAPNGSSLWLGTGRGIAQYHLPGEGWAVFREPDGIGRGGVSALTMNDTIIWAATAYSEKVGETYYPAGGGVGWSNDDGVTWHWQRQPVDSADVIDYRPTTTNIQNVTYDIAITDSAVWIVSWGGGLRRLRHGSSRWELATVDHQSFTPLINLAHRVFSAVWDGQMLWVGSAAGVHGTADEGINWVPAAAGAGSISGNFVTALGVQRVASDTLIWAATWKAERASEFYGVSMTADRGVSWWVMLSDTTTLTAGPHAGQRLADVYGPLRAHNFGFRDSTVYVAADRALWISRNLGRTWELPLTEIFDFAINERLELPDFFSAATTGDSLWIGTDQGMALNASGGFRILRAHTPAGVAGQSETYAYPSPFSPKRGHVARLQFRSRGEPLSSWGIYNFAMETVVESGGGPTPANIAWGQGTGMMEGYAALKWDGRDHRGSVVANGVYFYRLKVGSKELWGKVMVID